MKCWIDGHTKRRYERWNALCVVFFCYLNFQNHKIIETGRKQAMQNQKDNNQNKNEAPKSRGGRTQRRKN